MDTNTETQAPVAPENERTWPVTRQLVPDLRHLQEQTASPGETTTAEAVQRLTSQPVPGDSAGLHAEHRFLWGLRHSGRTFSTATMAAAAARHKLVIDALNELEQGKVRPVRPGPGHSVSGRPRPGSSAARAANLAAYKTALQLESETPGYFYSLPQIPSRAVPPWISWLLRQDTVQMSVGDVRGALTAFQVKYLEAWNIVHFKDRIAELQLEISDAKDSAEIKALQEELAILQLPTAPDAASANAGLLSDAFFKAEGEIRLLLLFCKDELQVELTKVLLSELEMYENHICGPLPVQKTSAAVKAIEDAIALIDAELSRKAEHSKIARPHAGPVPPNADQTALNHIFGLSILG